VSFFRLTADISQLLLMKVQSQDYLMETDQLFCPSRQLVPKQEKGREKKKEREIRWKQG